MAHQLPPLPYAYDALEPHIDAKTMEIHHTKHHQTYVDKLNAALEKYPDLQKKTPTELLTDFVLLPEEIKTPIRNHAGGHANHTLFWQIMGPQAGGQPSGDLHVALTSTFGSFEQFKQKFTDLALNRFGSGWAWLVVTGEGDLAITSTANQDSPFLDRHIPILGLDVWEHAYYLKYQSKRPDYITAWWNVVNWTKVAEFYNKCL